MNNEDEKFNAAFVEMMTKAARQFGFKGDLEITITRPKAHEQISKSHRNRKPNLRRRKSVSVL